VVRQLDLSQEGPLRRGYQIILCRNVVIYFERPMQERLFQTFADALEPGGYLVLGKVETLFGPARDRLVLVDPRERVYRRPA
jgi:chemotaxis protein methyltransferase CheR